MITEAEHFLILAPSPRDAAIARGELEAGGIASVVCSSIEELCREISAGAGGALLTEDDLDDSARQGLEATLSEQPAWSDFPLLVLSARRNPRQPDDDRGIRGLGNVTLLDRPLRVRTMCRAAHAALRARRRQYAAAKEIDERDRFLAMLGHELRNPLSVIGLAVDLARKSGGPSREIEIIERQVQHLGRLVDDLLDVARVTAGKIVLQKKRVDVATIIRQVAGAMEAQFAEAGVALRVSGDDACVVLGDQVRLEQVMTNLLTNALKYTPEGGDVVIAATRAGGKIVASVEDTGVGIAADVLPRIFDAFAQADDDLARSQGGMGVGLTLVRSLVTLHGGSVSAASEGRGRGTRIEVRLPAAPVDAADSTAPGRGEAAPREVDHLSIVVVDDNQDQLSLLATTLELRGHRVTTAANGETGVAAISEELPDAAIVDIGLPDIDGFEVARRIRDSLGRQVRLIALSGYGQDSDRERAAAAGFDTHLTKPADLAAVLNALEYGR